MASIYTAKPFSDDELRALRGPDPQPAYAEMTKCPVHRGPDGTLTLTRMKDVVAVAKDPEVLGAGAHGPTMGGARPLIPLDLDGPAHTRYRRLLDPLFSARRVARYAADVSALADQLIDGFIGEGRAELRAAFCDPLPSLFFLRLMGLPERDVAQFLSFKDIILGHRLPPGMPLPERFAAIREASARCYRYLGDEVDRRVARGESGDNLIGWLLDAEVDGEKLQREQILDIGYLMIIGGLDTAASSLGLILTRLARTPALRQRLLDEPALWDRAIDEFLRFDSPVRSSNRTATRELVFEGERIPAGTTFFLSWAAANVDPEAFPDALSLDLDRKPNLHVAYGSGFHRCLGSQLARMELRAALEQFHRRIPDYRLEEGHALAFDGIVRTVHALPLVWKT